MKQETYETVIETLSEALGVEKWRNKQACEEIKALKAERDALSIHLSEANKKLSILSEVE